jgi:hypothetical protein
VTCAWDNFPPNEQTINVLAMKLMKHESLVKMQNENHVAYVNKTFFSQSSRKMKDVKGKEKKKGDSNYIKKLKKKTRMAMYSSQQILMGSSTMLLLQRFFTYPTLDKIYS